MASFDPSLVRERTGRGPRVVLVHGFTQTGASWRRLVPTLSDAHEVYTVDLPGHGRSGEVAAGSLEQAAVLLGESTGRASYVGYSLGGRVCLTLAHLAPERVERLVLIGASPGIDDADERAARRRADEAIAARLEGDLGLAKFLDEWLAGPLFSHLSPEQADVASRLENTATGLAASLRSTGSGTQVPSADRLGALEMPVLLVAGERDVKFSALAEAMAEAIGSNARVAIVPGAGHAACFEQPERFAALLGGFLAG